MTQEAAMKLTQKTLADCSKRGLQVAGTMVERSGIAQIMICDRFAGPHTPKTARRKTWTAASFLIDISGLADATNAGVPVEADGSIVGGTDVSGPPSGSEDDACARVVIDVNPNYLAVCTCNHLLNKTKR